ncbi:hypothetical protein NKH10_23915 [Mesorhizobium sp. M1340]|uniref:hypothetical protein n=1 Tax=unclassified Mesorhizobium TaxID=325217 RepID=UPI00333C0746
MIALNQCKSKQLCHPGFDNGGRHVGYVVKNYGGDSRGQRGHDGSDLTGSRLQLINNVLHAKLEGNLGVARDAIWFQPGNHAEDKPL